MLLKEPEIAADLVVMPLSFLTSLGQGQFRLVNISVSHHKWQVFDKELGKVARGEGSLPQPF